MSKSSIGNAAKKEQSPLDNMRHSFAHLLAAAVKKLYPEVQFGIGPVIENGFYYDFGNITLSDSDLARIEKEMRKIAERNLPFKKELWDVTEARKYFEAEKQPYKVELVDDLIKEGKIQNSKLGMVSTGDVFLDLCRGGHVKNTSELPLDGFVLDRIAGAYWRGDEKRPMLTRVYGIAFATKRELDEYKKMREEAEKRDHRKLGKELQLYTIIDEVGPGLPLFYPKGAILRRTIENFIAEIQERYGYLPIWIPHITKSKLYEISGHLAKYDAMYPPMHLKGEDDYYIKPMNCPHFMMLYKSMPHSYRDLPIRWTSTTTNYRYEKSGELSGLTRVRALTQDDCHVFCRADQVENEIGIMLNMIEEVYQAFGLKDFWVRISLRDPVNKEKYIGHDDIWRLSENALKNVVGKKGWESKEVLGEAAFYGPKLDFMFKDVLGREWQLSTIQLDMNLSTRFHLEYTPASEPHNYKNLPQNEPVVIHRAILGATERFLGILIEHYAGAFPLWLAPEQVWVVPIGEKFNVYAKKIAVLLQKEFPDIRLTMKDENDTLGKKIREGQTQKIPYLLIVGEKEKKTKTVSVRSYTKGDAGAWSMTKLFAQLKKELKLPT